VAGIHVLLQCCLPKKNSNGDSVGIQYIHTNHAKPLWQCASNYIRLLKKSSHAPNYENGAFKQHWPNLSGFSILEPAWSIFWYILSFPTANLCEFTSSPLSCDIPCPSPTRPGRLALLEDHLRRLRSPRFGDARHRRVPTPIKKKHRPKWWEAHINSCFQNCIFP